VVGFWWMLTETDNYAWNPLGKDLLMLDIALTSIFYFKTLFWLVIANLTVFIVRQLFRKKYKLVLIVAFITSIVYFFVGQMVDKKCAFHYYSVFLNQSVSEEYNDRPILKAGYQIGPIITESISNKEMKFRRYAIGSLEKIKYKPATQVLTKILHDKTELDVYRADALVALTAFDTEETREIITNFRNQATDSLDRKVIELGDYFIKNK
jgi:hypothetical protein